MCARGFVHATAGVADGQLHMLARGRARMLGDEHIVQIHVRRRDRELPTGRHRVSRVHRQVHHYLFDLSRI
jgi:hypothetical protein